MKLERLLLAALVCAPAWAAPDLADLEGRFKRINGEDQSESVLRFELAPDGESLKSTLEGLGDDLSCTGTFRFDKKGVLRGWVRWVDDKYGTDAKVPWMFRFEDADKARGSCGWLDTRYQPNDKRYKGYTIYFLERLEGDETPTSDGGGEAPSGEREGWLTADGGGDTPSGETVDADVLAGGWAGPAGPWSIEARGERLILEPVGHSSGVRLELEAEGDLFAGDVTSGAGTQRVELAFDGDKLVGRSAWSAGGEEGWAPVEFTRLRRLDAGEPAGDDALPEGSEGEVAGAYRRDDGLYLRLNDEGVGELVQKDGGLTCRVSLRTQGGVLEGSANFDGVEARWELARTADGLVGRCEWVDVHDGTVIARGWSARSFERLKRAF
ncbi:MAG: hypothetical protein R3F62_28555 [Planctomycetota bacterium]